MFATPIAQCIKLCISKRRWNQDNFNEMYSSSVYSNECLKKLKFLLRIFGVWFPRNKKIINSIYSSVYLILCAYLFIYVLKLTDQKDLTYGLYWFCGFTRFIFFLLNFGQLTYRINCCLIQVNFYPLWALESSWSG